MADENEKQKEPEIKMSPETETGLKKALGTGGILGDSADAMFGGIKSAAESTGRVEQIKQKQAEALAKGELGASRAFADTASKQFEAMKAARGEMPKRDIEEHTMQGLIGLGALLPMAGAMLGNKGLASGTGAMQAMAGLFNGYREGNKERIAFEQKRYDDQMKQWENHARQLESDFRNAIEISKSNLQAGHDAAKLAAVKAGAPMIAAMVDQQGALKTLEVIEKTITQTMAYDAAIKKAEILQGIKTQGTTERHWTDPQYKGGQQIAATGTVAQHLSLLEELALAEKNKNVNAINSVVNRFKTEMGAPQVTNFNTAKQFVASELVRAGTGVAGALADRKEAESNFGANRSPDQILGSIDVAKRLIAGRLAQSADLYKAGTGKTDEDFIKLLSPKARQTFLKYLEKEGVQMSQPSQTTTKPITTEDPLGLR